MRLTRYARKPIWLAVVVGVGGIGLSLGVPNGCSGPAEEHSQTISSTSSALTSSDCGIAANYPTVVLDDNPIAYWRLNENASTASSENGQGPPVHFADSTGHGYDATVVGNPQLAQQCSAVGGDPAVTFQTGTGATVAKRYPSALSAMSIEAWVKSSTNAWQSILDRDVWNNGYGFGLYIEWQHGDIAFGHYGTGQTSTVSVTSDGKWHYVVGTLSSSTAGNDVYSVYVDGAFAGSTTAAIGVATSGTGALSIGSQNGASYSLNGGLSEVALYDKALSADQIRAHYNARARGFALGCLTSDTAHDWTRLSNFTNATIESCIDACRGGAYVYAGLALGTDCYCGRSDQMQSGYPEAGICNTACAGNPKEMCGGKPSTGTVNTETYDGFSSVYTIGVPQPCTPKTCAALPMNCGTLPDGCGGTITCGCAIGTCDSQSHCYMGAIGSMGCQTSDTNWTLMSFAANANTIESCMHTCGTSGYPFTGLHGNICYCGQSYNSALPQGTCNTPCPGSSDSDPGAGEICGGNGTNSAYATFAQSTACTPKTCADVPSSCGTISNGCGGTITCGCALGTCDAQNHCSIGCLPSQSVSAWKTINVGSTTATGWCIDGCLNTDSGYPFASVLAGVCSCGTAYNQASQVSCGSGVAAVFATGLACQKKSCADQQATCGPTFDGCGGTTPDCGSPGTTARGIVTTCLSNHSYIGCLAQADAANWSAGQGNTIEGCVTSCANGGHPYAGFYQGTQCFCGGDYGHVSGGNWSFTDEGTSVCSGAAYQCAGNPLENCGGPGAAAVYMTGH